VHPSRNHRGTLPAAPSSVGGARDEVHAFIVRLHLSIAGADGTRRARFSVEDVGAGNTDQFASFAPLAAHLEARVHEIVSGPRQ
jgi:hypothetical protein